AQLVHRRKPSHAWGSASSRQGMAGAGGSATAPASSTNVPAVDDAWHRPAGVRIRQTTSPTHSRAGCSHRTAEPPAAPSAWGRESATAALTEAEERNVWRKALGPPLAIPVPLLVVHDCSLIPGHVCDTCSVR